MTKRTQLKAWSFSLAMVFEECKYRVKLERLDRIPDKQPRPAADRGSEIHDEAQRFVEDRGEFTNNLRHFYEDFVALHKHYLAGRVSCEEEWGFTKDWQPCTWKDADIWLRLKCDAVVHLSKAKLVVIDHKTGKRFGNEVKHARQLQLYALCSLIRYPEIEEVVCELWYLDQNELAWFTMKRRQLSKFLKIYDKIGVEMTNETKFPPSPNIFSCKYCPYSPSKQGDCEFGFDANAKPQAHEKPIDTSALKPLKEFDMSEFKGRI